MPGFGSISSAPIGALPDSAPAVGTTVACSVGAASAAGQTASISGSVTVSCGVGAATAGGSVATISAGAGTELIVTVATIMRASQTNLHGRMSAAAITMTVSF